MVCVFLGNFVYKKVCVMKIHLLKLASWKPALLRIPFSCLRRDVSGWQVSFPASRSLHAWCTPQCLFYRCCCEKWPPGQAFLRRRHPESFCKVFFPPPWVVNEWNEAKHRAQGLSVFLSSPFYCPGESKPSKIPVHVGVSRTWGSSKEGGSR